MKRILYLLVCLLLLLLCACEQAGTDDPSDPLETESTEAHSHEYATSVVSPSCTDGYTIHTCLDCGYSYTDGYVEAMGHRYQSQLVDVSCNKFRYYTHTCEVCGYSYTSKTDLPGTRHSMEMVAVVPPSREKGGYTLYICKYCMRTEQRDHTAPSVFSTGLAYVPTSDGYYVSGIGDCRDTAIVIPSVNEYGHAVKGIAEYAFSMQTQILSIEIPDTVRVIGEGAFMGCAGLTSLTIPRDTSVGRNALLFCSNLETLTMPLEEPLRYYFQDSNAPDSLKTLHTVGRVSATATLAGGSELTTVTLSEETKTIPPHFFENCVNLETVIYSDQITAIGAYAFANTPITEFKLPLGVTRLRSGTFAGCTGLERVVLHDNLREIESHVFEGCTALSEIELPDSLQQIGECTFAGTGLQKMRIPSAVTVIPSMAFFNCTSLSEFTLHDHIVSIGTDALSGSAITSFTYPKNLTEPISALQNCTKLTSVTFNAHVKIICGFMGCSALESITLPEGVITIDMRAFEDCTALKTVHLPSSLETIGGMAFEGCTSLKEIVIPDSITKLEDHVFSSCSSLESVTLPQGLTVIGNFTFWGCGALRSISLPDSLTEIGCSAFSKTGFTEIELPARIKLTASGVFSYCPRLERVTVHTELVNYCFAECPALREVTLGEGITSIPSYAFYACSALTQLTLPESLKTVGYAAFANCTSLRELTIPKNVVSIDSGAMLQNSVTSLTLLAHSCTVAPSFPKLETLTVGDGVQTIPANLCANSRLRELTLPCSIQSIGSRAFFACTELLTVDFGGASVELAEEALLGCDALETLANASAVRVHDLTALPEHFYIQENALIRCLSSLVAIDMDEIDSTVSIPEGILHIAPDAFRDCNIIKSISLPSTLLEIGDYALAGCTRLREIALPSALQKLGVGVFMDCTALESVVFPDGIEELPALVLGNCTALSEISVSRSIKRIAPDAYTSPTQLSSPLRALYTVYYGGTAAEWTCVARGENNPISTCTVICTDQTLINTVYEGSVYNSNCTYKILSDQTLVLSGTGYFPLDFSTYTPDRFKQIERLVVSEGITGVNSDGFSVFAKLEELSLPSTLTDFAVNRLSHTPWYQSTDPLAGGFFTVGSHLLDVSTALEGTVTVPDGITLIGASAFSGCNGIREIRVPEGIVSIDSKAFSGCAALERVLLPQSLQQMGSFVFFDCPLITEIVVPQNVKTLGSLASHCDGLRTIVFEGATEITDACAYYCPSLEYILLGEGMLTLPTAAIYSCHGLRAIVIPESMTEVASSAFSGVSGAPMLCFRSSAHAEEITAEISKAFGDSCTAYLYSEEPPTEAGNWWHFDENGIPVAYE